MHSNFFGGDFRCTQTFLAGIFDALKPFGEKNRCTEHFLSRLFDALKGFWQQFSMLWLATSALKTVDLEWNSWVSTWGEVWTGTSSALILISKSQKLFNAVVGVHCIEKSYRLGRGSIVHLGFPT